MQTTLIPAVSCFETIDSINARPRRINFQFPRRLR